MTGSKIATPVAGLIAGLAGGVAVVIVLGLLIGGFATQQSNQDTLQLIKDCTIEPAGKCAELQRQQGRQFTHLLALANACADRPGHQTVAQIERCMRKGTKDDRAAKP